MRRSETMQAVEGSWRCSICRALSVEVLSWPGDGWEIGKVGVAGEAGAVPVEELDYPHRAARGRASPCSGPGRPRRHIPDPGAIGPGLRTARPASSAKRRDSRRPVTVTELAAPLSCGTPKARRGKLPSL